MNSFPTLRSSNFCYNINAKSFSYSDGKCSAYPINTDCVEKYTNSSQQLECELCKNKNLADKYLILNHGNSKNALDMKEQYQRSWYQTGNLGGGILFLLICIYYQK
jgi:hypothetical protein